MRRHAALGLVLTILLTGCGGDDDSTTLASEPVRNSAVARAKNGIVPFERPRPGSGKGVKLGYIALGDQVPFSKLVSDSMKRNARLAGAQLIVCDSRLDGQIALDCARSFKTQGVKAYLNYQGEQRLGPAICSAGPKVPVIAISVKQRPCQTALMGAANEYAGYIAGRAVGEYAKRRWRCEYDAYVSLESVASGDNSRQRMGGYRAGFQSVCRGGLKNERVLDADRTDSARTKVTDALTALPGQHRIIVVGINDDSILGAIAAAKTAGRMKDIHVSGQGADASAWCEIKSNPNWIADSAYFPERYGEIGIPYLIRAARGGRIPRELFVRHELITAENIDRVYQPRDC